MTREEKRQQIVALIKRGMTAKEIVNTLGVSQFFVRNTAITYGLTLAPGKAPKWPDRAHKKPRNENNLKKSIMHIAKRNPEMTVCQIAKALSEENGKTVGAWRVRQEMKGDSVKIPDPEGVGSGMTSSNNSTKATNVNAGEVIA